MPDSRRIIIQGNASLQIFDLATMQEQQRIPAPGMMAGPAIAVSPDREMLAWALEDNSIVVVRIADRKVLGKPKGHSDVVTELEFTPDGKQLVSASHDTWVRVWSVDGSPLGAFQPSGANDLPSQVLGMGISPDGRLIATIPSDGPVKLWDMEGFGLIRSLGGFGAFDTSGAAFSPDGKLVAADLATGLFLWRVADGSQLLGGNPGINSMAEAFSPDGQYFAYSEIGERVTIVLSSPDGAKKIRVLEGLQGPVWKLVFSPDSSLLAGADAAGILIWRVQDGKLMYIGRSVCPPRSSSS
jgi:WD40 repeat protein